MSIGLEIATVRYAGWLPYLSPTDRAYVYTRGDEMAEICAEDPSAPPWLLYLYQWTAAALDAENPARALREAVASTDGDPEQIDRALTGLEKIAAEWADAYEPDSGTGRQTLPGPKQ